MTAFVTVTDVRLVGNLKDDSPEEKYLQPHLDSAIMRVKSEIGEEVYDKIIAGAGDYDEDDQGEIKLAICLLAIWSMLSPMNRLTGGEGIVMSQSDRQADGISGTTRYMNPNEISIERKALKEQAYAILDSYVKPLGPQFHKVL